MTQSRRIKRFAISRSAYFIPNRINIFSLIALHISYDHTTFLSIMYMDYFKRTYRKSQIKSKNALNIVIFLIKPNQ